MRSLIAFILLIFILLLSEKELLVYTVFKLNQSYIISELCVNRDRKDMSCKGRCMLKKTLKEVEKKEEEMPAQFQSEHEIKLFTVYAGKLQYPQEDRGEQPSMITLPYDSRWIPRLFVPPEAHLV